MYHIYMIYIYIYIAMSLFFMSFLKKSMLLNYANPCRNWTFHRFARVAEKNERNGTNEKSDTRLDLNPGPRLVAPMIYLLSYGASRQNPNFYPYKLSNLKFIPPLSFLHVDFLSSTCCLVNCVCFFITVHS